MTVGEEWGWSATKEESRKIFDAYVDAGSNFVDTAHVYTEGISYGLACFRMVLFSKIFFKEGELWLLKMPIPQMT